MEKLMLGNEAIARGAYEAGVKLAAAYPGTPSTEITEAIAKYPEIYAEWAPNEKVAAEVAIGASFAGARAIVSMKHVGVNVAADPIFTLAYTGVNGGLVIIAADDPGMHSSQNEQDSRYYAMSAHIPMLEPSDSQEAKDFVKYAFELSEQYDTPVFVRTTTRISHSQSLVTLQERQEKELNAYQKNIAKYAMMPAMAKGRHIEVEKREVRLALDADDAIVNRTEWGDKDIGVICSGAVYNYVKEALPNASVLKLGMVYPLPKLTIAKFAATVKTLYVIEELEPIIEREIKAMGIECIGKELFSVQGEILTADIREKISGKKEESSAIALPARPPVMCAGCPHRGVFYVLHKLGLKVSGDIGCYTLGAQPPLFAIDSVVCMGASIGISHGMDKVLGNAQKHVAVIGDSTFVHSGITGLINTVYNKGASTVILLDNSTTGMTGHQDHPATGVTLKKEQTHTLDLELLAKAVGVKRVFRVDAYDINALEKLVKQETEEQEVSLIIAKRPCALLDKNYKTICKVNQNCKNCKACLKIGCPAIRAGEKGVQIDESLCTGCGLCTNMCKFSAINKEER